MIIHFDARSVSPFIVVTWYAACGPTRRPMHSTTDPDKVTCGNCKRTVSYRAKKAET